MFLHGVSQKLHPDQAEMLNNVPRMKLAKDL